MEESVNLNLCLNCHNPIVADRRSKNIRRMRFHKGCMGEYLAKCKFKSKSCGCGCGGLIAMTDKWGNHHNYIPGHYLRGFKHSADSKNKMRDSQLALIRQGKFTGRTHPSWKGGRWFSSHGYAKIWVGRDNVNADSDGYVYEHTLQLQKYLCRALTKYETGHHENGIKDDNRIGRGGNIQLMMKSEHTQFHSLRRKSPRHDLSKRFIKESRQRWLWLFRL